MYRTLALSGVLAVMCVAFSGDCLAQGTASRFSLGGVKMPTRSAGGVLSPRISPVVALFTTPPKTPKAMWTYGLTILSPRAAAAVGMIRGAMGLTAGLR